MIGMREHCNDNEGIRLKSERKSGARVRFRSNFVQEDCTNRSKMNFSLVTCNICSRMCGEEVLCALEGGATKFHLAAIMQA
jgi:hypothetical protein